MKKLLLILPLLATLTLASAQSKGGTTAKAPKAAPKVDTTLCSKRWDLVSVEEFSVVSKPNKKQADDHIWMTGDGKYNLKRNGEAKAGTWTRQAANINFTDAQSKEKFTYKVISSDDKKLKIDYHTGDDHTLFTFEVK